MMRHSLKSLTPDTPAAVQIPYRAHVAPRVVITGAGDYLMSWRLTGLSFECADDSEINAAHERLNAWLRNLASPEVAIWSHVIRRREHALPAADAPSGFARRLLHRYRRRLERETLWANELYVTLVYRPLGAQVIGAAIARAARRDAGFAANDRAASAAATAKLARQVEAALEAYEPMALGCYEHEGRPCSALLEFLALLINGEWRQMPLPQAPLEDVLGTTRLLIGWETIEYRMPSQTRFGACLGIKEYPTPTTPGQLNRLLTAPFPFVLTQSFAFLAKSTALGLLSRQIHRLRNAADVAVSQATALKAALDQLGSNEFVMGDHHLTLQVMTEPRAATDAGVPEALSRLEQSVANARAVLGDAGIVVAREDFALEAAFWGQLPGNFIARPRRAPITSRNFAGLAALHNFPAGRPSGNHWGDALTVLKTSAGSPYHFSLHATDPRDPDGRSRRDTGHTFICGPTGSGKTVFLGFCLCLLLKHGATQVVFDKDRGLEILVRALGGQYLAFRRGVTTGCNPLQLEATPVNRAFLRNWLQALVHRASRPLSVREEAELEQGLDGVLTLAPESRRLSRVLEFLDPTPPDGLYARLAPWCAVSGGEYATVFDSPRDRIVPLLGASPVLGFDMTAVLDDSIVRGPLTQYLFHILESLLDGRRLVVWLDEFAKLIADPGFEALASDGTKTWRKRNGVIAFATQSPNDVLRSRIARTLIEQTPTKVFFPNADAHRSDYVDGFGLSDREFELIRTELTPGSRRFLIKQGRESVVAELDLKGFEAELKVISARSTSVAELQRLIVDTGPDPGAWLPRFLGEDPPTTIEEVP
jgi:type IV secretion system protein VirB4